MNGKVGEWKVDVDGDGEVRVDGKVIVHWVVVVVDDDDQEDLLALFYANESERECNCLLSTITIPIGSQFSLIRGM